MKKTLFLTAVMAFIAIPAQAAGTTISTTGNDESVLQAATTTVSVGSYAGAGSVTISDGPDVQVELPADLFIGGSGYYTVEDQSKAVKGNNGTVTVGEEAALSAKSVNVGNTKYNVTGKLVLGEEAVLNATQLVVGAGNGTGIVTVGEDAEVIITKSQSDVREGILIGGAPNDPGKATGTMTVAEGATLTTNDTDVYVGVYGTGKGTLNISAADVDLTKLHIGSGGDADNDSTATGVVNITDAEATVNADTINVWNKGTLNITGGAVTVSGTATDAGLHVNSGTMSVSGGLSQVTTPTFMAENTNGSVSKVTIKNGATLTGTDYMYLGKNVAMTVDGGSIVTADTLDIGAGTGSTEKTTSLLVDNASSVVVNKEMSMTGDSTAVVGHNSKLTTTGTATMESGATMELANSSKWIVTDGSKMVTEDSSCTIYFTTDSQNQSIGLIEYQGTSADNSQTQGAKAVVWFKNDVAEKLLDGDTEVRLTSSGSSSAATEKRVSFSSYAWERSDGTEIPISYTEADDTENQDGGTLLLLARDGDMSLVNQIVADLSQETTQAAVNSMNASIAAMGAMFDVVKTQIKAPHNVDLPVGNVASDSKLSHSGRYMVGANRVWGAGLAVSDRRATDNRGTGYHYEGGGYAVGYDRVITPHMYVGAGIGNIYGKYKANNELMRDSQNAVDFTLYARHTTTMPKSGNRLNVDAYLGYGNARNRGRAANYNGGAVTTGRWNDQTLGGGVTVSYEVDLSDSSTIVPFVGIEGIYAWQNDFIMAAATGNSMQYSDGTASVWTLPVGVTYRYTQTLSATSFFIPEVTVAYLGDVSRKHPKAEYTRRGTTSGVSGRAYGAIPDRSGVEVSAGATYIFNSQWMTGAFYSIDERDGDCEQNVHAYVSYSF